MKLYYVVCVWLGICVLCLAKTWALNDLQHHLQTDKHSHTQIVQDGDDIRSRIETKQYMKHEDHTWLLSAVSGVWALVFKQLSIEPSSRCEHDYLEVVELTNSTDAQLPPARFCGEQLPMPYISRHPNLRLRFVTDGLWELEGFWIRVVHGNNTDILAEKMDALSKNNIQPPLALLSQKDGSGNDEVTSERGTLFFILIGASSASLLVFGALLVYFIVAMRRAPPRSVMVPGLYYKTNSQAMTQAGTSLNGGVANNHSLTHSCRAASYEGGGTGHMGQHGDDASNPIPGSKIPSQPEARLVANNTALKIGSKRGKRYYKDKPGEATRTFDENTFKKTDNTFKETNFVAENSHHNNLYTIYHPVTDNKNTHSIRL